MMVRVYSCILFYFTILTCSGNPKIVGGTQTIGFPETIQIFSYTPPGYSCTAVRIAQNALLTAAHCVLQDVKTNKLVPISFRENDMEVSVSKAIKHKSSDIAVLFYQSKSNNKPIATILHTAIHPNQFIKFLGFGQNTNNLIDILSNKNGAGIKRIGFNKILSINQNKFSFSAKSPDGNIKNIKSIDKATVSHGDSGGPIYTVTNNIKDTFLIGIHSTMQNKENNLIENTAVNLTYESIQLFLNFVQTNYSLQLKSYYIKKWSINDFPYESFPYKVIEINT